MCDQQPARSRLLETSGKNGVIERTGPAKLHCLVIAPSLSIHPRFRNSSTALVLNPAIKLVAMNQRKLFVQLNQNTGD